MVLDYTSASNSHGQLYANDGKGKFTNVTAGSGLDVPMYGNGVACGDYDNDGRVDLFITTLGLNRLFQTKETASLQKRRLLQAWVDRTMPGVPGWWFDCDIDGDLDLFAATTSTGVANRTSPWDGLSKVVSELWSPTEFTGAFRFCTETTATTTFTDISRDAGIQVVNRTPVHHSQSPSV